MAAMKDLTGLIVNTELKIGWTLHSCFSLKRVVEDWTEEQELAASDSEWVDSIFEPISTLMNAEECIDDIFKRDNSEECEDPDLFLMQYFENLLSLEKQVGRYAECLKLNAWLDKPCWKVYQAIFKIYSDWEEEVIEPDDQREYLDDLSDRLVTIVDTLSVSLDTFSEVYENASLNAEQNADLHDFERKLGSIVNRSRGTLVLPGDLLEKLKNATFAYCACRGHTAESECRNEFNEVHKLIVRYRESVIA